MSIGFLLGAGFSKALHPSMPMVSELLKNVDLPTDLPNSIQGDLELILSYLWTNYPWNTDIEHLKNKYQFLKLNDQIYSYISDKEFQAWTELLDENPLRIVSNVINRNSDEIWQARFAGIISDNDKYFVITMNYYTLLERLMMMNKDSKLIYPAPLQRLSGVWNQIQTENHGTVNMHWFNEYRGLIFPSIFKLHGSISWYSLDRLEANVPIYSDDMNKGYTSRKNDIVKKMNSTLTSIIVPPVADKSSLYNNKILRSQWIGASQALQDCDTLYCVGYSFPQSDFAMRLFLGQACNNVKKVVLVDIKDEAYGGRWNRIKSVFPEAVEVEYIIGEDCVKQMAIRLFEEVE